MFLTEQGSRVWGGALLLPLLPAQEADWAPHPPLPRIIVHYHAAVRV